MRCRQNAAHEMRIARGWAIRTSVIVESRRARMLLLARAGRLPKRRPMPPLASLAWGSGATAIDIMDARPSARRARWSTTGTSRPRGQPRAPRREWSFRRRCSARTHPTASGAAHARSTRARVRRSARTCRGGAPSSGRPRARRGSRRAVASVPFRRDARRRSDRALRSSARGASAARVVPVRTSSVEGGSSLFRRQGSADLPQEESAISALSAGPPPRVRVWRARR